MDDSHRKRVLLVTHTRGFGGAEKHTADLVANLRRCGADPWLLCFDKDPFSGRITPPCEVVHQPAFGTFPHLVRLFRSARAEIVVFVHNDMNSFPWRVYAAARMAGRRRIYAIHHLIPESPGPKDAVHSIRDMFRTVAGWRVRRVAAIRIGNLLSYRTLCVSEAVRSAYIREYGFNPATTVTTRNGVDTTPPAGSARAQVRRRLGIAPEEFVVATVCRLAPEKGLHVILDACAALRLEGCRLRWIIVGSGPMQQEVEQRIRAESLQGMVLLPGFCEDVRPYLQAADLFVLASFSEGLPLSILEAMALGLPCVVSDVAGNPEAVLHEQQGLVIPSGSS